MSTAGQRVTFDIEDDIGLVGLNRPDKCNAIDSELTRELSNALELANRQAKVCVLHGHGAHFCAGLDLEWMRQKIAGHDPERAFAASPASAHAMSSITRARIPYIVAIQGAAIGLGFELAAAAHIRVADESAFFELPEGRRGIFVGGGGSARISRLIGVARMQDMMLTGRRYRAAEALQVNIVQYAVPAGTALEKALELARQVKKNSALSNFAILAALPRIATMTVDDGLFWEDIVAKTTFGPEASSRLSAFLQKSTDR